MEKHENMVASNRKRSQDKVNLAVTAIKKMVDVEEQVVVCNLMKKTGLSRAFFYNNQTVHEELLRAQELQEGKSFVAPQKIVISKAMDREIELLRRRLKEKDREIVQLKSENVRLQKALNAKTLDEINNL